MRKLIYRDLFFYLGKQLFNLPVFALLFIFIMQMFKVNTGFALSIITMSLLGVTLTAQFTFQCDESSKFNRFLRATPISVKSIILSRYASCLLSGIMGGLLLFVAGFLINMVSVFYPLLRMELSIDFNVLLICIIILALICAILLPLLYRYGYTKAKYILMFLIIALGSSAPMLLSDSVNNKWIKIMSHMSTGGYLIIIAFSLFILYGSTILSIAIFNRKEV